MKDTFKFLMFPLGVFGILFGSAGTLNVPFFLALMAIIMIHFIVVGFWVMDPELRKERMRPAPGGIDRHLRWVVMPFFLAHWVIAGLHIRFDWPGAVPVEVQIGGLVGVVAAMVLAGWSISVNRFFSPVIRIQEERGHHLVTTGPYQFIRHPGYLAGMGMGLCSTLALGSWWAMAPIGPVVFLMIRRAVIEDRFLQQELDGYADYAQRVRFRLVPGIW